MIKNVFWEMHDSRLLPINLPENQDKVSLYFRHAVIFVEEKIQDKWHCSCGWQEMHLDITNPRITASVTEDDEDDDYIYHGYLTINGKRLDSMVVLPLQESGEIELHFDLSMGEITILGDAVKSTLIGERRIEERHSSVEKNPTKLISTHFGID